MSSRYSDDRYQQHQQRRYDVEEDMDHDQFQAIPDEDMGAADNGHPIHRQQQGDYDDEDFDDLAVNEDNESFDEDQFAVSHVRHSASTASNSNLMVNSNAQPSSAAAGAGKGGAEHPRAAGGSSSGPSAGALPVRPSSARTASSSSRPVGGGVHAASSGSSTERRERPSSASRTRPTDAAATSSSATGHHPATKPASRPSSGRRPSSASRSAGGLPSHFVVSTVPPPPANAAASAGAGGAGNEASHIRNFYADISKQQRKRTVPNNFFHDPEGMYEAMAASKRLAKQLEEELTRMKTRVLKAETEAARKDKQLEEILRSRAAAENTGASLPGSSNVVGDALTAQNLVRGLKQRIRQLEKDLGEKETECVRMRQDARHTRVRELETELKAYYTETRRLQKVVDDLSAQMRLMHSSAGAAAGASAAAGAGISASSDQQAALIIRLRERNLHLSTVSKTLKADYESLRADMEAVMAENEQLRVSVATLERKLAGVPAREKKTLADAQTELGRMKEEAAAKETEAAAIRRDLEEAQTVQQAKIDALTTNLELAGQREESLVGDLHRVEDENAVLQDKCTRLTARVAGLEAELAVLHTAQAAAQASASATGSGTPRSARGPVPPVDISGRPPGSGSGTPRSARSQPQHSSPSVRQASPRTGGSSDDGGQGRPVSPGSGAGANAPASSSTPPRTPVQQLQPETPSTTAEPAAAAASDGVGGSAEEFAVHHENMLDDAGAATPISSSGSTRAQGSHPHRPHAPSEPAHVATDASVLEVSAVSSSPSTPAAASSGSGLIAGSASAGTLTPRAVPPANRSSPSGSLVSPRMQPPESSSPSSASSSTAAAAATPTGDAKHIDRQEEEKPKRQELLSETAAAAENQHQHHREEQGGGSGADEEKGAEGEEEEVDL